MLPNHNRFPRRGPAARRPASKRQAQAMLPAPGYGQTIGAFEFTGPVPQDIVGAVTRELRTSMLDVATALRVAGPRGRLRYFGTVLPPPQRFASPAQSNSKDTVRSSVVSSGNASRSLNKNTSRGKARELPRPIK